MRVSAAAVLLSCSLLACGKSDAPWRGTGPTVPYANKKPPPTQPAGGPCAADAECSVWLDSCDCQCAAHVGAAPAIPNATWATMCDGRSPINCGVASPCTNLTARCDAAEKVCQLERPKTP